jgi:AraC-like DNA-binding protein
LEAAARSVAVSKRTLERRFRDETGFSLGVWAQQARMLESLRRLASGSSVSEAALHAGYRWTSAYISAFRRTFNATPGQMYAESTRRSPTKTPE